MQVSRLFNWVSPENCICWVDYIEWPCDGHGWMICRYRTLVYALAALSAYREIVAPGNPLRFHVADLLVQDLILWMFLQCYQARECSRLKPRASQLVSLVPVVSLLCLKSMKESEAYRSCGSNQANTEPSENTEGTTSTAVLRSLLASLRNWLQRNFRPLLFLNAQTIAPTHCLTLIITNLGSTAFLTYNTS